MYVAGYVVTGFILAAVYAFERLRGRWGRYERTAVAIALAVAALASIVQGPVGDWAARDVVKSQPTKLAALEGLPRTTHGAPSTSAAGMRTVMSSTGSASPTCSRCWQTTAGTRRSRAWVPCLPISDRR